jgi:hypothetical protein
LTGRDILEETFERNQNMYIRKELLFPDQYAKPAMIVIRQEQPAIPAWLQVTSLTVGILVGLQTLFGRQ